MMNRAAEQLIITHLGRVALAEVRHAHKRFVAHMVPGEQLIHAAACTFAGHAALLAITDRRVVVLAQHMLSHQPAEYPLATIEAITSHRATDSGSLVLHVGAANVRIDDIHPPQRFDAIATWLRANGYQPVPGTAQLTHLHQLVETGQLTHTEYGMRRADLLANLSDSGSTHSQYS